MIIKQSSKEAGETSLGLSIGTAFNSRAGVRQLSINTELSNSYRKDLNKKRGNDELYAGSSLGLFGTSSSFSFGTYTYSPKVDMPMKNFSVTGNFKFGGEFFGIFGNYTLGGYFSTQRLETTSVSSPAYGYMNYDAGTYNSSALMDFNRENDGAFSQNTPALPLTSLTYDIYSVSGQGVGGSYRPFRSDVGFVYDNYNYTTSDGLSIGAELGTANLVHWGGDISVNSTNTYSGWWTVNNSAASYLHFKPASSASDYEPFYFKEANEKSVDSDPTFVSGFGGTNAERFNLDHVSKFNTRADAQLVDKYGNVTSLPSSNTRRKRDRRNQVIYQLTRDEVDAGYGLCDPEAGAYSAPGHHIAEITTYGTDGMRYVYGLPAYNTEQDEVTFATGEKLDGSGGHTGNCTTGLVGYSANTDNSVDNTLGIDNYYSRTSTPAYAHSYLLTAVLSPDYIDADNVKGPSINDLGYYTRFYYSKVDDYHWRVPVQADTATWNQGLYSDPNDDKGSYIYGKKELWYLDSIVSKNYIAIFTKENRKDGFGVVDENGGIQTSSSKAMKLLRKISLYSLTDYHNNGSGAVPIKEVHFEYDYSLCPGVPNNSGASETVNSVNLNANKGKLTLKKVYFTYRNSNKARLSPYQFSYNSINPSYDLKGYDRWGNYKPNVTSCGSTADLNNAEYPYVSQDQAQADSCSSAWSLTDINLPSGGKISITYESDDYAYVQNKNAMEMFRIVGVEDDYGHMDMSSSPADKILSNSVRKNRRIYFKMQSGYNDINSYFQGISRLYFRCLMSFDPNTDRHDFVPGYCNIDSYGDTTVSGTHYGWIRLQPVKLKDSGSSDYNPIVKSAIQFGRMNLSRFIWDQTAVPVENGLSEDVLNLMVNSSFVKNIFDAIEGPNKAIWDKDRGRSITVN
ncbi:MAG TPA: hypothetical protein VFU15_09570, partial [Bacteroidia bacterium]|nr:hypothetical protein [Bacteroidia bacterium]